MQAQFSLEHIGLAAQDTALLKDWYVRALEARVVYTNAEVPAAYILELRGGAWIEIYPATHGIGETSNNKLRGWRHLALRVNAIEAAQHELESRGVRFEESIKPAGGGGRVLFFRDPEGNLLHLVERPTDSPLVRP